jgi:uncharacterized integral membrane protein
MKFFSTIFYVCLFAVMGVFAFLNPTKVSLDYYWGTVNWPLGVVVIIAFVIGGVLGRMAGSWSGRRIMKKKMLAKFSNIAAAQEPKVKDKN